MPIKHPPLDELNPEDEMIRSKFSEVFRKWKAKKKTGWNVKWKPKIIEAEGLLRNAIRFEIDDTGQLIPVKDSSKSWWESAPDSRRSHCLQGLLLEGVGNNPDLYITSVFEKPFKPHAGEKFRSKLAIYLCEKSRNPITGQISVRKKREVGRKFVDDWQGLWLPNDVIETFAQPLRELISEICQMEVVFCRNVIY
jgi:hypothetical protein